MPDNQKNFDDLKGDFFCSYLESRCTSLNRVHIHDAYEILLVLSEGVEIDVNNETYPVPVGAILLFNTLDLHLIRYNGNSIYKRHVIWFKNDFLNGLESLRSSLLQCFFVRGFEKPNLLIIKNNTDILNTIYRLDQIQDDHSLLKKLVLAELLTLINNEYFASAPSPEKDYIYNAILYIQENYSTNIDLALLAKSAYTNKRSLNESFLRITGLTVGQYVLSCRLTAAKAFLVQGMPVSEVCDRSGFGNLSNFSRTFRNHVGMSPKQYALAHKSTVENAERL